MNLSEVHGEDRSFRIDSNFYQKEFLSSALTKVEQTIGSIALVKSGTTPADREDDLKEGVVLLKTTDIRGNILSSDNTDFYYISPTIAERLSETALCSNDVLINIVGATTDVIGRVSLISDDFPASNITQAMALIRVQEKSVKPTYVFAFLLGKYGNQQVRRIARQTGQYNLNLPEVRSFKIPFASDVFQNKVEEVINQSHSVSLRTKSLYANAENQLLAALELDDWQPPEPLTYEYSSGAVWAAGRLDAEHYQPKYDALIAHIQKHAPRCRVVDDFAVWCKRGVQPEYYEDGELSVINSRHILENGLDYDNFERTAADNWNHPAFFESRIQRGDVLIYTTGAKIGRTAVYLEDERALASNHVNIVRVLGENPIYVGVALNSMIGRWQTRRNCAGSAQVEIYPSDIRQFVIPFVDKTIEDEIVSNVESSHFARRRAKRLLEAAKRAVEIAIEENEDAALAFLEEVREDRVLD